jgi:hypothetical protein
MYVYQCMHPLSYHLFSVWRFTIEQLIIRVNPENFVMACHLWTLICLHLTAGYQHNPFSCAGEPGRVQRLLRWDRHLVWPGKRATKNPNPNAIANLIRHSLVEENKDGSVLYILSPLFFFDYSFCLSGPAYGLFTQCHDDNFRLHSKKNLSYQLLLD